MAAFAGISDLAADLGRYGGVGGYTLSASVHSAAPPATTATGAP